MPDRCVIVDVDGELCRATFVCEPTKEYLATFAQIVRVARKRLAETDTPEARERRAQGTERLARLRARASVTKEANDGRP